jgi:hypothetical protein
MQTKWIGWVAAAGAGLLSPQLAHADAIDGNWCHPDGRRFSIQGPEIVTPAGTRTSGNYDRHFFSYVIPDPEPAAGQTVFMTLYNENIVHLRAGETDRTAPGEVWNRCAPSIS